MTQHDTVAVTLPADVQQIDHTGYVWSFLDEAAEPERVQPGALIVAGDAVEPFLARVVDVVAASWGSPTRQLMSFATPAYCRSKRASALAEQTAWFLQR